MRIAYIAGPYRGDVAGNICRARAVAVKYWQAGWAVVCPHMNSAHLDGTVPDHVFLAGDLAILARCDALVAMVDWRESLGACAEVVYAKNLGIEIIYEGDAVAK